MKKIFIATTSFAELSDKPLRLLKKNGLIIDSNKKGRKLTESEMSEYVRYFDGIIAGTEKYTEKVLIHAKDLKIISRLGVGLDNIDLDIARQKNIKVFKTQSTPAPAVAELALGLILDLLRKISYHDAQMKAGKWKKNMGSLLSGKTLGIIGLGTIGKHLVELTHGFGLTYLAHDIIKDNDYAAKKMINYCELDDLLSRSDVISIHINLTYENAGLINYDLFKKMKKESILINTSRGEIVNESELAKALEEKIIAGAGLDVFNEEPYSGSLLKYKNVVTTPHVGSYAREVRIKMELEAAKNLIKGLEES